MYSINTDLILLLVLIKLPECLTFKYENFLNYKYIYIIYTYCKKNILKEHKYI